jgi:thioredoxin 1
MGKNMRRALIILISLFSIFLAIGCTGNQGGNRTGGGGANETGTPVQAVTTVEVVTGAQAATPAAAVTGAINQTGNMTGNMTDDQTGMNGNVSGGTKPILMDFFAIWCGPCKTQKPILEELENKYGDKVTFNAIDLDENQQLASEYGIYAVPTLIILKDGVEVKRFIGVTEGKIGRAHV